MKLECTFEVEPKPIEFKDVKRGNVITLTPTDQTVWLVTGTNDRLIYVSLVMDNGELKPHGEFRKGIHPSFYLVEATLRVVLPKTAETK